MTWLKHTKSDTLENTMPFLNENESLRDEIKMDKFQEMLDKATRDEIPHYTATPEQALDRKLSEIDRRLREQNDRIDALRDVLREMRSDRDRRGRMLRDHSRWLVELEDRIIDLERGYSR